MEIIVLDVVANFIRSLQKPTKAKITRMLKLLQEKGIKLCYPYSKKISGNLYELRIRGQEEIRLFYTFESNGAIVVHGFKKQSNKIPRKEIRVAIRRINLIDRS